MIGYQHQAERLSQQMLIWPFDLGAVHMTFISMVDSYGFKAYSLKKKKKYVYSCLTKKAKNTLEHFSRRRKCAHTYVHLTAAWTDPPYTSL